MPNEVGSSGCVFGKEKSAWKSAVELVRPGGRVLWFGGLPGGSTIQLDPKKIHYGEISLINSHGGTARDAREAFDLITSRKINTQTLISEEMPLSRVEDALKKMIAGDGIKIALIPKP